MLVKKLIDNITIEEIDISNTLKMIKLVVNENLIYKKISEIQSEYKNLKIVSYKTNSTWSLDINPSYQVKKDDMLVILIESRYLKDFYINI